MSSVLEVRNLCKTYIVNKRQNNVLKNVNFTVSEGEMVAVMGPSGSGKTTFLYTVSGMDGLTAGEVLFGGKSLAEMKQRELANLRLNEMGFIFQQMYMLKNLTVLDNIILPACQSNKTGESRRETVARGKELIRKLGIIDVADNDINEVSGGQLQRACICRSMMNRPRVINGGIYRFDYEASGKSYTVGTAWAVNIILAGMSMVLFFGFLFVRQKILVPFVRFTEIPDELARGNLTAPIKENKSRYFGRFIWGVNLLRENMELQKQRELELHRSRKTLLLSLSHDIKTPVSAIKLYTKALSRELYPDREKQREIAENINAKADEMERYVSQIINASREDFLNLEVNMGEFYVSELMDGIVGYYREKLVLVKTDFSVSEYADCLLRGDMGRSIEVVQNMMENAIKYGDGKSVGITVYEEEGCTLVEVCNSGCTLPQAELPHIFESFWRGSNSEKSQGSGLGLYICRQLMGKMGGEIFAQTKDGFMAVTAVFPKA